MKAIILSLAMLCSMQAVAGVRITSEEYPRYQRMLLMRICAVQGYRSVGDVREAEWQVKLKSTNNDGFDAYQRGLPAILKYLGPDYSNQFMYMVEGILYNGPLIASQICNGQ